MTFRTPILFPAPKANSRPGPKPSHCLLISHRVPAAWWVSPVSDVSCEFGVSGPAHRLRGRSRSDRQSSSWYTPGHRAPLWSTQGWEPGIPKVLPPNHLRPFPLLLGSEDVPGSIKKTPEQETGSWAPGAKGQMQSRADLPNKDARMGPSTGSIKRASFS